MEVDGGFLVLVFVSGIVTGIIGAFIGEGKGRGQLGFWLGFFFSLIGIIIVAVLEPTEEERKRRLLHEQNLSPSQHQGSIEEKLHREAVAQAINEHPELAASQETESLRKLGTIISEIERDKKLVAEINAAKLTQGREEQEKQQVALKMQDEQMSKFKRLIQFDPITSIIVIVLSLCLIVVLLLASIGL